MTEEEKKQPPQEKKNSFWKWLIWGFVIFLILALIGAVSYLWILKNNPTAIEKNNTSQTTNRNGSSNWIWWVVAIGFAFLIGIIIYLTFFRKLNSPRTPEVFPLDAQKIFKSRYVREYNVPANYNHQQKIWIPNNPDAIKLPQFEVTSKNSTGDIYMIFTIDVSEGDIIGLVSGILILSQGQEAIDKMKWKLYPHKTYEGFQPRLRSRPMTTPQDKKERMMNQFYDHMDEESYKDILNQFQTTQTQLPLTPQTPIPIKKPYTKKKWYRR